MFCEFCEILELIGFWVFCVWLLWKCRNKNYFENFTLENESVYFWILNKKGFKSLTKFRVLIFGCLDIGALDC